MGFRVNPASGNATLPEPELSLPPAPAAASTPGRIDLPDPRAKRLVDPGRGAPSAVGIDGSPADPRVLPAKQSGDRKQYIVTVNRAGLRADVARAVDASITALRTTQDDEQKVLSRPDKGRYVLFLDGEQAAKLREAGVAVLEDRQITIQRPPAGSVTPKAGQLLSRQVQGADDIKEPGFDGAGVLAVVIDTGVAPHPDLATPADFDDVYTPAPSDPPVDDAGHGTHVSGIIGAKGDPAAGHVKGEAPAVTFKVARVLQNGSGSWSSVLAGVERAVEWAKAWDGPVVFNLSLGGPAQGNPDDDPINQALNEAVTKYGVFVAVSAGNSGPGAGTIGAPGTAKDVVTVAAMDHGNTLDPSDDSIAPFSSRGKAGVPGQADKPTVAADGVNVLSTVPGGGYESWSGTSMAAPNVAGAGAALLGKAWALYKSGDLAVDPRELVKAGALQAVLYETTRDNPAVPHTDEGLGDVRVDAAASLLLARYGRAHVKRAVRELQDVADAAFADDGSVSGDEAAELVRQLLAPDTAATLPDPTDRLDYLEAASQWLDQKQAGKGPKLPAAVAAELRGVMARMAEGALLERARRPFKDAAEAQQTLAALAGWLRYADGVTAREAVAAGDLVSAACEQLPAAEALVFLRSARDLVAADPALAVLAGKHSRLHEVAHQVLGERARQPFASASDAATFLGAVLELDAGDPDATPALAARHVAQTASAVLRRLAPAAQVAFVGQVAPLLGASKLAADDQAAVLAQLQASALAALSARAAFAAEPFASGTAAATSVADFVDWQKRDGAFDGEDVRALAVLLDRTVRGGALDAALALPDEKKAFLRGTQETLQRLARAGDLSAAQRVDLWRQVNDAVNEQVRSLR